MKQAQALSADLVYVWPPQAAFAAILRQVPVLFELHEPPSGFMGPLIFWLILTLPGHGGAGNVRFLPITQVLADILARAYPRFGRMGMGLSQAIAPDGVDLERYLVVPEAATARRELGLPEARVRAGDGHAREAGCLAIGPCSVHAPAERRAIEDKRHHDAQTGKDERRDGHRA